MSYDSYKKYMHYSTAAGTNTYFNQAVCRPKTWMARFKNLVTNYVKDVTCDRCKKIMEKEKQNEIKK